MKSAADLHDRSVLIAGVDSISRERMEASFAAAGARGLAFKQGAVADVAELWDGKVAAAIVAVAQPDIAAGFRQVPGYRMLLVQVSPPILH